MIAASAVVLVARAPAAHADESVASENAAPDSAVEVITPVDEALSPAEVEAPVVTKKLSEAVKNAPPVIRDAQFKLNLRAYTFDRETVTGRKDAANALGGEIFLETGRFADIAKIGLSYYTSNPVGSSEHPGFTADPFVLALPRSPSCLPARQRLR